MVDDINKVEFLEQQLDLLKRKQKDSNIEWQDIADFRSDQITMGNLNIEILSVKEVNFCMNT